MSPPKDAQRVEDIDSSPGAERALLRLSLSSNRETTSSSKDARPDEDAESSSDAEHPPLRLSLSGTPDDAEVPSAPSFLPTRDAPWIEDDQRDMLKLRLDKLLEDDEALISLSMYLEKRAEERLRDAHMHKDWDTTTMKNLIKGKDTARALLHRIPRKLLRSLVMGTIGWQTNLSHNNDLELRYEHADALDKPGTYVATIGISGRRGKGLSGDQYLALSERIDDYIEAYSLLKTNPDDNLLPQQAKDKIRKARRIDRFYSTFDHSKEENRYRLAYVDNEVRAGKMRHLSRIFKEFHLRAEDKTRPLIQTISYVGCATRSMKDRSANHMPTKKYKGSNYTWWLTMSCIRDMNMAPEVTVVAAVQTWEPDQLPMSEILVSILGRTEVEVWGYNCTAPGSTTEESANEPMDWDAEALEATAEEGKLTKELDRSIEEKVKKSKNELLAALADASAQQSLEFDKDSVEEQIRLNNECIKALDQVNEYVENCLNFLQFLDNYEGNDEGGVEGGAEDGA
ncbi:hypothetical protein ABKA04_002225 [Annulohypoxylon sp. FPYF3050]